MQDNNYHLELSFAKHLETKGKKQATVQSYCLDIRKFLIYITQKGISLEQVDLNIIKSYQLSLESSDSKTKLNSVRRKIIAIRLFFRFINESGAKLDNLDHVPIPFRENHKKHELLDETISKLFEAIPQKNPLKASRDAAMLALFCFEGIKASELIELRWEDLLLHKKVPTLFIKHGNERVITLNETSYSHIKLYQKNFMESTLPHTTSAKIFIGFKGKEHLCSFPSVSRHGLKWMLAELGEACKIQPLNSEVLRGYAINFQLASGKTPQLVQKHLGLKRLGNILKYI